VFRIEGLGHLFGSEIELTVEHLNGCRLKHINGQRSSLEMPSLHRVLYQRRHHLVGQPEG
jgi:hypothetical protein